MIGRILIGIVAVALVVGGFFLLRGGEKPPTYKIVLDNAFGLIEGADLKAAGVKVGKISKLEIDMKTNRALVTTELMKPEFADFRKDVTCSVEPQSLIGEYFLNCQPGTDREKIRNGGTIPVEQTSGTIPADLVNNIMRRPWRERFGIILNELGVGLGARGPELQETIKRAIPALRDTDRVLKILADNRNVLRQLNVDAAKVMTRLSGNRGNVARFVSEARDTARASAERRGDLATNIRLLPRFLRELRPVLRDLGTTAERQAPALRDLRTAAPDLELLLRRLGPFADASRPALNSLGEASKTGTEAMRPARATIKEARELADTGLEPIKNLRYVLEHVDDRRNATDKNRLSPGGLGFTGLEALLQYFFVQSQAINIFDTRGYSLKLNALISPCSGYRNAKSVRDDPELARKCSTATGPGPAPGIDYEVDDRKSIPGPQTDSAARAARAERDDEKIATRAAQSSGGAPAAGGTGDQPTSEAGKAALVDYLLAP